MQATIAKLQQLFRERRELQAELDEVEQAIEKELGEGADLNDVDAEFRGRRSGEFHLGTREVQDSEAQERRQMRRQIMKRLLRFRVVATLSIFALIEAIFFAGPTPLFLRSAVVLLSIGMFIAALIGMRLERDAQVRDSKSRLR